MDIDNQGEALALIHRINRHLKEIDFNRLWRGFRRSPYALYNDKKVFLVGHPGPPQDLTEIEEDIYLGDWTADFCGCTDIKFNDEYIAIWDMNAVSSTTPFEQLVSGLIHEMFHVHQRTKDDGRYANELLYFSYPFTEENIALRIEERKWLVKAVFAKESSLQKRLLSRFISCREMRRRIIEQSIYYELGAESTEGTARYVEYKAFVQESKLPDTYVLAKFGSDLAGDKIDLNQFRKSCYSSGAYIGILLDRVHPDWCREYDNSSKYLYDFFLENVGCKFEEINIDDYSYAQKLIRSFDENRKANIEEFQNQDKYQIVFCGECQITGFDPMNIIARDNLLLHQRFLRFMAGNKEVYIRGQVLSKHEGDMLEASEIQTYVETEPTISGDLIRIDQLGEFGYGFKRDGNKYLIYVE